MKTREELVESVLRGIAESGELVSAENSAGVGFTDYLIWGFLTKEWSVYNFYFSPKNVKEISVRRDGIFIVID